MSRVNNIVKALPAVFLGLLLASAVTRAEQNDTHKTVDGMDIYIGVIPAEVVKGRDYAMAEHMHGGVPLKGGQYHLVVALFDHQTGSRVTNATVDAAVAGLESADMGKRLDPMEMAGALTYGNYFKLSHNDVYQIGLQIRLEGADPVKASFRYSPSGR